MPAEEIGEFLLRPIIELVLQLFGYFTARIIFPLLTFGYITVAPAQDGVKVKPKWHGFNRASNGKVVLHEEMGALLGIIFWFCLIVSGFAIHAYIDT